MTYFDGRLPDGDRAFRIPEAREALTPEHQVLLRVFETALDGYEDLESVKKLATVEFVNYLNGLESINLLNAQNSHLIRQLMALQLERRELLGRAIEDKETIESLARQSVDLAKELEDLRSDW
ncbi:hypothetical protein [Vacuolonema iberomarrocanum]|uniref:hypothetical protein n=1 Tax=Vacuolonema iberomarrocanum TaxID=3454632 RepID=UPI0019D8E49B|nr:hypothetical protein [filamentous cyanobacterium LEGE 07170]